MVASFRPIALAKFSVVLQILRGDGGGQTALKHFSPQHIHLECSFDVVCGPLVVVLFGGNVVVHQFGYRDGLMQWCQRRNGSKGPQKPIPFEPGLLQVGGFGSVCVFFAVNCDPKIPEPSALLQGAETLLGAALLFSGLSHVPRVAQKVSAIIRYVHRMAPLCTRVYFVSY